MSQQTDLKPITPSFGHLVSAWLRPWAVVALLGFRLAPALVTMAVGWTVIGDVNKAISDPSMEAEFAEASRDLTTGMTGMMDLVGVLLVVLLIAVVVGMLQMATAE